MKLPGLLYKLGVVDVSRIEQEVLKLTEEQWTEWDLRQKRYVVHSSTETFPFIFSEYGEPSKTYNHDTEAWNVTSPLIDKLEKFYNRKAGAAILVKLKPYRDILLHTDAGWFNNTNRVHIPIITDPNIFFSFKKNGTVYKYHLKRGEIYEFNNLVEHGVTNQTATNRVHLMVDMLPNSVLDPGVQRSRLESIGYSSLEIKELLTA